MAHVIEKHYDHSADTDNSSAASLVVLVVAVLLIAGLVLFAFGALPFTNRANSGAGTTDINVEVPNLTPPAPTEGGTTPQQ